MKKLQFLSLLLFVLLPLYSFSNNAKIPTIPDNSPARRSLDAFLQLPISEIRDNDRFVLNTEGRRVQFEVERSGKGLYLIFAEEGKDDFDLLSAGNVIIRRNIDSGYIEQVKFYLDNIGALVLRASPAGRQSRVSLSLFDSELYANLMLPQTIEQVMFMNPNAIISLTNGRIPWENLFPPQDNAGYNVIENIVFDLRQILPSIPDADDGAMDVNGSLVRIETNGLLKLPGFNCSGFAKYVSDPVYYQLTGSYMDIALLKEKHYDLRGGSQSEIFEDSRDPYFGLDWTRNIASTIASIQSGIAMHKESKDIRENLYYDYSEDRGFHTENIAQVLYLESIENPGNFYLGSVNGEFGSDPSLWQHYHVIVLFPYFDSDGNFNISVMERNTESTVASLKRRYSNQFIHIVEVKPEETYKPIRFWE